VIVIEVWDVGSLYSIILQYIYGKVVEKEAPCCDEDDNYVTLL